MHRALQAAGARGQYSAHGMHTYYGGMSIDYKTPSYETWKSCIVPRERDQGLPTVTEQPTGKFDVVYGNPPCSRFSTMSASAYSSLDQGDLSAFCELGELLQFAKDSEADVVHWETGPLLWTHMDMARQAGRDLFGDDGCTTVIVKIDLLHLGVPQRRPRCHVVHARGRRQFDLEAHMPEGPVPLFTNGVGLRAYLGELTPTITPFGTPPEFYCLNTMGEMLEFIREFSNFHASKPVMLDDNIKHSPAVLSGRFVCWHDRWWGIEEYAVQMGYDPEGARQTMENTASEGLPLALLAKSVSPYATNFVRTRVVEPLLYAPMTKDAFCGARDINTCLVEGEVQGWAGTSMAKEAV